MSQAYWRFIARFTFIVRYGWKEYRTMAALKQPRRGIDFWDLRPGLLFDRYHKQYRDGHIRDQESPHLVQAWPRRLNLSDLFLADGIEVINAWVVPIVERGLITVMHLTDMGVVPSNAIGHTMSKPYCLAVGWQRPDLSTPLDPDSPYRLLEQCRVG